MYAINGEIEDRDCQCPDKKAHHNPSREEASERSILSRKSQIKSRSTNEPSANRYHQVRSKLCGDLGCTSTNQVVYIVICDMPEKQGVLALFATDSRSRANQCLT